MNPKYVRKVFELFWKSIREDIVLLRIIRTARESGVPEEEELRVPGLKDGLCKATKLCFNEDKTFMFAYMACTDSESRKT